jgi:hypothetical protein
MIISSSREEEGLIYKHKIIILFSGDNILACGFNTLNPQPAVKIQRSSASLFQLKGAITRHVQSCWSKHLFTGEWLSQPKAL